MELVHIKRSIHWTYELLKTLFLFWLKNPTKLPSIVHFILKKSIAFPRFLNKNVLTEKHSNNYQLILSETTLLYKKYGNNFDPKSLSSYRKLDKILHSKAQMLYFLVRKTKPNLVVETGVAAGESTGFILQALKDNGKGRLYSIDLPFQWYIYGENELHLDSLPPGKMPGYLVPKSLHKYWTLILGDTYKKLPILVKKLNKIDLFLHDSEHTEKTMTFEYNTAWPYLNRGGWLLSDDVDFTNAFSRFTKKHKLLNIEFKKLGVTYKKTR